VRSIRSGDRAWQHGDVDVKGPSVARAAAFVGAALVVDLGVWFWARASRDEVDSAFVVHGILLAALALTSGTVAEFGLSRRRELAETSPEATRHRPWPVVGILFAALVVLVTSTLAANTANDYPQSTGAALRGSILVAVTAMLGWPAATALYGVRQAALGLGTAEPGNAVEDLRRLRDLSRRLLEALGSLVSLTTLALGAAHLSQLREDADSPLALEVLVFGAGGTAVVGALYLLPYAALQDLGRALAQQISPLAGVPPEELPNRLAEREALERGLGISAGITSELLSRIIVAGPVVAGAVTLLISSR
jgi:hypothetical protein